MSSDLRKVIEKNQHGEYEFTPYGEFLSYYHAHLQIFSKIIESKKLPTSESEEMSRQIKSYMVANVKKSDHFFESIPQFSSILSMPKDSLQNYLNANFIETLNKVQAKLKTQEIEKLSSPNQKSKKKYERITEELVGLVGEIFPKNCKFVALDGKIVIQNISTGELIEPSSTHAHKEEEKSEQPKSKRPEPVEIVRPPEKPLLAELIEMFGSGFTGQRLEIRKEILESIPDKKPSERTAGEEEDESEPEGLEDVAELQFEDEQPEPEEESQSEPETESGSDSGMDAEEEFTRPFTFREFMEIIKKVQAFQAAGDSAGYTTWMNSTSDIEKSFLAIRNSLIKESKGEKIDWNTYLQTISAKTGLRMSTLTELKSKTVQFNRTKAILDICIKELKTVPPDAIGLVKSAWPHILKAFEMSPDYFKIEASLKDLMSRVKNPAQREPIERVLSQAILKLKS
ncbi:MAG: hypothetical protein K8R21_05510 [Leptospira sp.]|nr:hypothetical protein [Leptospira sp.]